MGTVFGVIDWFIRLVIMGMNTGNADLMILTEKPSSPDAVC